jgi:4-hydroxybenzoyl-CoA thioesterase
MERFFDGMPGGYAGLIVQRKIGFPAVHVTSDFTAPLRFGDVARIEGTVTSLGRTSCRFQFVMSRARDGVAVAKLSHVHVCTDMASMTKLELPGDVRAALSVHGERL